MVATAEEKRRRQQMYNLNRKIKRSREYAENSARNAGLNETIIMMAGDAAATCRRKGGTMLEARAAGEAIIQAERELSDEFSDLTSNDSEENVPASNRNKINNSSAMATTAPRIPPSPFDRLIDRSKENNKTTPRPNAPPFPQSSFDRLTVGENNDENKPPPFQSHLFKPHPSPYDHSGPQRTNFLTPAPNKNNTGHKSSTQVALQRRLAMKENISSALEGKRKARETVVKIVNASIEHGKELADHGKELEEHGKALCAMQKDVFILDKEEQDLLRIQREFLEKEEEKDLVTAAIPNQFQFSKP